MSEPTSPNRRIISVLAFLFVALFVAVLVFDYSPWKKPQTGTDPSHLDVDPIEMVLGLKDGPVEMTLRSDLAPKHVERIATLAAKGFYDGIVFHRVIDGFMAQTGDPTGTGMGSSDLPDLAAEFTPTPFVRGAIGMARSSDPDSANSQFFIMFDAAPFLDGQYTYVGAVTSGMEYVDAIKKGDPDANGQVEDPDHILSFLVSEPVNGDQTASPGETAPETGH